MMKKNKMPNTSQNIEDMLDSDEELPTEYSEMADIPAYLNDNRFGSPTPEEIPSSKRNYNKYYSQEKDAESTFLSPLTIDGVYEKTKNLGPGQRVLIFEGVLSEQDLYCLKCIQPFVEDDIVLWFLQYMIKKDLQSNTKFLKSCLVSDFIDDPVKLSNNLCNSRPRKYNFDIVSKDKGDGYSKDTNDILSIDM